MGVVVAAPAFAAQQGMDAPIAEASVLITSIIAKIPAYQRAG